MATYKGRLSSINLKIFSNYRVHQTFNLVYVLITIKHYILTYSKNVVDFYKGNIYFRIDVSHRFIQNAKY